VVTDAPTLPDKLTDLHAVVLLGQYAGGDAVRWDRQTSTWWRANRWRNGGFATQEPPATDDTSPTSKLYRTPPASPAQDHLEASIRLVERLERDGICQHCAHEHVQLHGIAPDVFGTPTLICVLRPNSTMVSSSGGGGSKKHWGSPGGCTSTKLYVQREEAFGYAEVGHVLYGKPLTSFQVFDLPWCARCASTAWNMYNYAHRGLEQDLGRPPTEDETRDALRTHLRKRANEDHQSYVGRHRR
jgi:hypothetical protein